MNAYLKIKLKSLAAEAVIIREEEKKYRFERTADGEMKPSAEGSLRRQIFWGLREHRIKDVREESRSASLAYGFLRGRRYRQIEATSYVAPNWKRVETLVLKYAHGAEAGDLKRKFEIWKSEKVDDNVAMAA